MAWQSLLTCLSQRAVWLQRDWAPNETAGPCAEILFALEGTGSFVVEHIYSNQFVTRPIRA